MMRVAAVILIILAGALKMHAANAAMFSRMANSDVVYSHTGQFIIHGRGAAPNWYDSVQSNTTQIVSLNPNFLAVSAERIKAAVLQELRVAGPVTGKIHLILLDRFLPNQPVAIVSELFADGWQYQVSLPARIDETMLVKAIVQTTLLQIANRDARRSAELPTWLLEGMTQQALASPIPTFVDFKPDNSSGILRKQMLTFQTVGADRIRRSREILRTNACLTIQQLSFPNLAGASEQQMKVYQSCAHLLLNELLKLPNGPQLMSAFIATVPQRWNWQTAFLEVYRRHFRTLLEFEKWWALTWIDFSSHDHRNTWAVDLSLQRLRTVLSTSLDYRANSNSLPVRMDVPLQQTLAEMDFGTQKELLEQKQQQLFFLRFNMAPETLPLLASYQNLLQSYIQQRQSAQVQPGLKQDAQARERGLVRELSKALDALDQQQSFVLAKAPQEVKPAVTATATRERKKR